jgi:glycosyltransferase involved in cell wall biosynthesis
MFDLSVSIITVVRNGDAFIEQCILSVLNQSYRNIEYIIIDGGSQDRTLEIIRKYEDRIDCWISEPDNGLYDAMNKGLGLAHGDVVGFLNSDDWYETDAVKDIWERFTSTNADVVYGNVRLIARESGESRTIKADINKDITAATVWHPSIFVKRQILQKNLFNTNFRISADYDLFLKLYSDGYKFAYCDCLITNMRTGGYSSSIRAVIETFKVQRAHGITVPAFQRLVLCGFSYYMNKLKRSILRLILPEKTFCQLRKAWLNYKFSEKNK